MIKLLITAIALLSFCTADNNPVLIAATSSATPNGTTVQVRIYGSHSHCMYKVKNDDRMLTILCGTEKDTIYTKPGNIYVKKYRMGAAGYYEPETINLKYAVKSDTFINIR